ncbi:hypothetical protein PG987_001804 [Apiospora arundinis]
MPNTLILVVREGVVNLFGTSLLLYKSHRRPPPKYSHGIEKCRLDVHTVLCRSLDKSAAQLERKSMALLSRYHSLRFDIALVPNKQYGPESPATRDRATAKQHDRATKPKLSISSPAERQRCQCREDVDGDTEDEYDTGLEYIAAALTGSEAAASTTTARRPSSRTESGAAARPHRAQLYDERYADRCDECRCFVSTHKIPDHSAMDASLQSAVCQNSRVAA